jgi:hypothetical protein
VLLLHGTVAQVGREAHAEIGDRHNRVLTTFERTTRQISRRETALQVVARTYATAPDGSGTFSDHIVVAACGI